MDRHNDVQQLVDQYHDDVLKTLWAVVREKSLPQQLVPDLDHEVWVRVAEHAEQRGGLAHVRNRRSWLKQVARNVARDHHQERGKEELYLGNRINEDIGRLETVGRMQLTGRGDLLGEVMLNDTLSELRRRVKKAVIAEAFLVVYVQGYTKSDGARRLGCKERTFRGYLRQAETVFCELHGVDMPERRPGRQRARRASAAPVSGHDRRCSGEGHSRGIHLSAPEHDR